jgi:hypothetical protein
MTRKHYQAAATAFGAVLRDMTAPEETYGATQTIKAWMDIAATDNPRFDRDRFMQWVREVRDMQRNLDGKRVA